jgi:hypothetical protein
MKKKTKNTVLIQTRISREKLSVIKGLAEQDGISVAAYVRRLILNKYRKDTGKDPYA